MVYGAPPSVTERRKYDFHFNQLSIAVEKALQALKWNCRAESPYMYHVYRPFSFVSIGENMTISIYDDGTIDVHSESIDTGNINDYGKNQRNINRFLLQLNRELGLVEDKKVERKKAEKRGIRKRVLGRKTGEPEDGELIER